MKAEIGIMVHTNADVVPCDHDIDNARCKARPYDSETKEHGFDPARCNEKMPAALEIRFKMVGGWVGVEVDGDPNCYTVNRDGLIELDGFMQVLRDQQMRTRV